MADQEAVDLRHIIDLLRNRAGAIAHLRCLSVVLVRKERIASANASTLRGGTMIPLLPSSIGSRQPGMSVVITARPVAIASNIVRGSPSR